MTSTSFEPSWQWPQDLPGGWSEDVSSKTSESIPGYKPEPRQEYTQPTPSEPFDPATASFSNPEEAKYEQDEPDPQADQPDPHAEQPDPHAEQRRYYRPRTCRICLETVLPTFHPPSPNLPGLFQSSPKVTYESEDGSDRLLRPCLCKGSQKYVHEACLTAWRMQNPLEKRNYWQCPTCKYSYRLERMAWGRWISSTFSQIFLTLAIFFVATFVLGFAADPIINLYLDPYSTITDIPAHGTHALFEDEPVTWWEHMLKGLASIGLVGFAKWFFTLNPMSWWNVRTSGIMNGARMGTGNTGRDRAQQVSWYVVAIGIVTVLWALWKGVRAWSRKTLEHFSDKVVDVPGDDRDDEDD